MVDQMIISNDIKWWYPMISNDDINLYMILYGNCVNNKVEQTFSWFSFTNRSCSSLPLFSAFFSAFWCPSFIFFSSDFIFVFIFDWAWRVGKKERKRNANILSHRIYNNWINIYIYIYTYISDPNVPDKIRKIPIFEKDSICFCIHEYFICLLVLEDGWLFGFYGISTFVGYLMPNPVYVYIKYMWFVSKYS